MATKTYSLAELKNLVLMQINGIKGLKTEFSNTDADEAYDEATRECGFENPVSTDADRDKKYYWLINRMRRWYLSRLLEQYILQFKSGDSEAQQIVTNLSKFITEMDKAFEIAKSEENTAYLFTDAATYFGSDLSVDTGFKDNRLGESLV